MRTQLDHLPDSKQTAIIEIRKLVLNGVDEFLANKTGKKSHNRIVSLILFGSYARGDYVNNPINSYTSDFDVLVITSHAELTKELGLWNAIEDKVERFAGAPVSLLVHTQKEVLQWLNEGHYFFSDIQKEGIYLYSYSGKPLPEPKLLTNEERLPVAQKHFEQWFESANDFLENYHFNFEKGKLKIAVFMLHQSVERYYSCLLLVLKNYRPSTHNIKQLRHFSIEASSPDTALTTIFADNDKFQRRAFELLKRAYIDSRYSEHYHITQEELQWLDQQVKELKEQTQEICNNYILKLS